MTLDGNKVSRDFDFVKKILKYKIAKVCPHRVKEPLGDTSYHSGRHVNISSDAKNESILKNEDQAQTQKILI